MEEHRKQEGPEGGSAENVQAGEETPAENEVEHEESSENTESSSGKSTPDLEY